MFSEIYVFTKENLRNLRDYAGITAVIPDEYSTHHSGFRLPEELACGGPLAGWQKRREAVERHARVNNLKQGAWPVFPGIAGVTDDSLLLKLIEEAGELGMEVWAHMGLWGYTGDILPEIGLVQFTGEPLPEEDLFWGFPLCPNNDELIAWEGECMAYAARNYNVAGIDSDHGHYSPAASLHSIFGCTCERCEDKAIRWGYDFNAIKRALKSLRDAFLSITEARFLEASGKAETFTDLLVRLADDEALLDWFRFREQTVTNHMSHLKQAVHNAAGDRCPLDSHYMPPSIALFSGQRMESWEKCIDRFTPGWGPVVGWDQTPALSIANIAKKLSAYGQFPAEKILPELIRLFGYGDDGILPCDLKKLETIDYSKAAAFLHEIRLAKGQISPEIPFLPPFRMDEFDDASLSCYREILDINGGNFVYGGGTRIESLKKVSGFLQSAGQL